MLKNISDRGGVAALTSSLTAKKQLYFASLLLDFSAQVPRMLTSFNSE